MEQFWWGLMIRDYVIDNAFGDCPRAGVDFIALNHSIKRHFHQEDFKHPLKDELVSGHDEETLNRLGTFH